MYQLHIEIIFSYIKYIIQIYIPCLFFLFYNVAIRNLSFYMWLIFSSCYFFIVMFALDNIILDHTVYISIQKFSLITYWLFKKSKTYYNNYVLYQMGTRVTGMLTLKGM